MRIYPPKSIIARRFEVLSQPMFGGMGIVYVLYDRELRYVYAAKTYQDELIFDEKVKLRFQQEVLAWINLDVHYNVTQAHFLEEIENKPYLFLEYVAGGSLSNWIGTPRLIENLPQVLSFAIQFCDGMLHILSKGIKAHRDIKPSNCLITPDNVLKVTDFGLAKVLDEIELNETEKPNVTRLNLNMSVSGLGAGTCTHMAPEQFSNAKHVDVRADIYSFGVLLYQMITGQLPFLGKTWSELEHLHKTQAPPPVNFPKSKSELIDSIKFKSGVSDLESLIHTCLDKNPSRRFASFQPVRDHLAKLYENLVGNPIQKPASASRLDAVQLSNKGKSLSQLGRNEDAIAYYDQAIEINPREPTIWANKAAALVETGHYEDAMACCDRALELNLRHVDAWCNKGRVLSDLGKHEEAVKCYDRAIEIDPFDEIVWRNKAAAFWYLGNREEMKNCVNRAMELNPRDVHGWKIRALLLEQAGQLLDAVDCYNRALEIDYRDDYLWGHKGLTLGKLKNFPEALSCFDRALELSPLDQWLWINKGWILANIRRFEEALYCCERALDMDSKNVSGWLSKGKILGNMSRPHESLACVDTALDIDPNNSEAFYTKGVILANLFNRYSEALECLDKAQILGHPNAENLGSRLRQQLGLERK